MASQQNGVHTRGAEIGEPAARIPLQRGAEVSAVSAAPPRHDEVMSAIRAGYESIDDGDDFWKGFAGYLRSQGYTWVGDAPCTCPDGGRHGHMPECRWLRT